MGNMKYLHEVTAPSWYMLVSASHTPAYCPPALVLCIISLVLMRSRGVVRKLVTPPVMAAAVSSSCRQR